MSSAGATIWWQRRSFAWALALAFAVPLLWPAIPPLTDLPTHMARYRVALDLGSSPHLAQYYDYQWALFGNLGVDLLVMPLARLLGLELAVKLVILAIPAVTVAGMLWLAREVHGKVPPTSLFALPLAYAFPFQLGFVNFTLGVALTFLAAALWLRLGRQGRTRLRTALFVPAAFLIWVSHAVAWGMLGLIVFALEYDRARKAVGSWWRAGREAALACLPLAPPALLMLEWWTMRSTGEAGAWQATGKLLGLVGILRDRSITFDLCSALLLYALLLVGARGSLLKFTGGLGGGALLLGAAFLVTPSILMGAAFADVRIAPYAVAVGILALAPGSATSKRQLTYWAIAGLLFIGARLAMQTYNYWLLDAQYRAEAAALDHIPRGAAVFGMAESPCLGTWKTSRVDHLASLATVRREAFVNGQWPMPGGRLLSVRYPAADGFALSPTQFVHPDHCRTDSSYSVEEAMKRLPREAFQFVWLINVGPERWPRDPKLKPVWRNQRSILLRIES